MSRLTCGQPGDHQPFPQVITRREDLTLKRQVRPQLGSIFHSPARVRGAKQGAIELRSTRTWRGLHLLRRAKQRCIGAVSLGRSADAKRRLRRKVSGRTKTEDPTNCTSCAGNSTTASVQLPATPCGTPLTTGSHTVSPTARRRR